MLASNQAKPGCERFTLIRVFNMPSLKENEGLDLENDLTFIDSVEAVLIKNLREATSCTVALPGHCVSGTDGVSGKNKLRP